MDGITKKRKVWLITAQYPCSPAGDSAFLLNEVAVLSRNFRLQVMPIAGCKEGAPDSEASEHSFIVRSLAPEAAQLKHLKWRHSLLPFRTKDFICEWIRNLPRTLKPLATMSVLKAIYRDQYWYEVFTELLKASEEGIPDLVYCYWSLAEAPGIARACNELDVPFVQRAHEFDLYGERNPHGFIPFQSRNIDRATVTFAVSNHGRDHLRKVAPAASSRIQTARLGVRNQGAISSVAQGSFRLVSCSSVIERKRVDLVARAVVELSQELPKLDFEWVHFGSGPLLDEIKSMVARRISDPFRVVFRGQIDNAEVLNFCRNESVSLFVNVSTSEGIPVSIMEAMSFGIPVLATDVGGTSEIVNVNNGILVSNELTPKDLMNSIREVIHWDLSKKQRIREMALRTQRDLFSAEKNYSAFASELLALVE